MAGIYGKSNIIAHVTAMGLPYWKVYYNQASKEAGNCIGSSNFAIPNLGMSDSMSDLHRLLDRLTPGAYLLTAYEKPDGRKGGVNTPIEIEANPLLSGAPGIGGFGRENPPDVYVEGIGMVPVSDISTAIDKKIAAAFEKEKKDKEWADLQEENKRLKSELAENGNGINRGLMAIGSVLYGHMAQTPAGKEFIGMIGNVLAQANGKAKPGTVPAQVPGADGTDQMPAGSNEERIITAIGVLSEDNPNVVEHLELLAKLKQTDKDQYDQGVDIIGTLVPND